MHLAFLDTETTGLADACDIWEIGLIIRKPNQDDEEYAWQLRPNLSTAEPGGLRIGRYYERLNPTLSNYPPGIGRATVHPELTTIPDHGHIVGATDIARTVAGLLDGATIIGAVPDFDTRHLAAWLRRYEQCGTWHYHLVDVETLAAGSGRLQPPWDFDKLLSLYGLRYDEADRHTALGDARMVRDLYDAVMNS